MEELTFNQKTKTHGVDGHGIDITSNEEPNHEVRSEDVHSASEPPTLIKGNVVEQGRLEADLVACSRIFVQEKPGDGKR
jgi:hypothetical protein